MNADDLERALRSLATVRRFRPYWIEFNSGDRILVSHPEFVDRYGELFLYRTPTRERRIFAGQSVSQVILPAPTKS
jgi:hypothetical protein